MVAEVLLKIWGYYPELHVEHGTRISVKSALETGPLDECGCPIFTMGSSSEQLLTKQSVCLCSYQYFPLCYFKLAS